MGCGKSRGIDVDYLKETTRATFDLNRRINMKKRKKKETANRLKIDEKMTDLFDCIDMKDGDESSTIQPWEGSLCKPSNVPKQLNKRPKITYEIEYSC